VKKINNLDELIDEAYLTGMVTREKAAEFRWTMINFRKRATGCYVCHQAPTWVQYTDSVIGSVPAEWWTCEEHFPVDLKGYESGRKNITPADA
jgi:hypothetical protein